MKRITGRESSGACSLPNSSLHLIKKFSCFIILASLVFLGFALFSPDALQAADTGLRSPTSNLADTGGDGNGYQGNSANAHTDDTLNAVDTDSGSSTGTSCTGMDKDKHRFYDYGFSIPGGSTVNGIEVRLDARADSTSGSPRICVQLSWNGGTTWTTAKTSPNLTTTLATYTLGNATDTWGRTWNVNDFGNANFRVRLINIASNTSRDFTLDWVAVRVHYVVPAPPTITSTPVTTGNVGQAYSYQATATGTTPITWSLVSPPSGMTIGSTTGLVTWTPGNAGSFPVTVRATNSLGSVDQSYTIVVSTPADTGLRSPNANAADTGGDGNGYQTTPTNAHADDTANAVDTDSGTNTGTSCTDAGKDKHRFYNYGFAIPNGAVVNGIEVRLDARADSTSGSPRICVQLSWDNGNTWTTAKTSSNLTTTLATYTLGNATDTWGRTWNANDFTNPNFRVRLINIASNTSRDFTLDWVAVRVHYAIPPPPQISSLSPDIGPEGTNVTIAGSSFGTSAGTVTFNGMAATVSGWNNTTITVQVPASATTGPVVVTTTGGVASNGVTFTVTPKINSLSPASGVIGTSITINGTNFGATQGTSIVTFNGLAATPSSWSDTSIGASVPVGASTGAVIVAVEGNPSSGVNFTVLPKIDTLAPTSGPVGTSVTLTGSGFGATQGSSIVRFNGVIASVSSWSAESIVTSVPPGAGTGPVVVTVGGNASTGMTFTVTVTPQINNLSPTLGRAGTLVTIGGTSFGATQGTSTVTFNGTAATPSSWSETSLVVPVPEGATTGPVLVTVGGLSSNGVVFITSIRQTYIYDDAGRLAGVIDPVGETAIYSYDAAGNLLGISRQSSSTVSIIAINPKKGPVGASVTISGTAFSTVSSENIVTFNGTAATVLSSSATEIVTTVPSGATSGPIAVTNGNGNATSSTSFTVTTP
ncbi:MAG: IPT/TIG domain-containing protein [Candidatus Manganitrophus sp. SB1]|nr:IPT/TIG domain-containing protein [Candidatus Manganitrophus morganii]